MAIDSRAVANRLREYRLKAGISQEAAAEALGVSRGVIVQLEHGSRSPRLVELYELASMYRISLEQFVAYDDQTETPLEMLLRADPSLDKAHVRDEVSAHLRACSIGVNLRERLGRSATQPPLYKLPAPESTAEAVEQGTSVAISERKRLGLGSLPILNVSDLIASQSIWVAAADLPESVSGLFVSTQDTGPTILVHVGHNRDRKRFSFAHEYAHALIDREQDATVSNEANRGNLIETRANAFAAALLMPAEGVLEALESLGKSNQSRKDYRISSGGGDALKAERRFPRGTQAIRSQDVALLAHHFGVSLQALTYRLRNLGVISGQELGPLLEQVPNGEKYLDLLGLLDDLKTPPPKEKAKRGLVPQVIKLLVEGRRQGKIKKGELLDHCELLGIPGQKLLKLIKED